MTCTLEKMKMLTGVFNKEKEGRRVKYARRDNFVQRDIFARRLFVHDNKKNIKELEKKIKIN